MRIVLLGDSHLARVRRALPRLAPDDRRDDEDEIVNLAVGGSSTTDLAAQVAHAAPADALVVSVGTNDAAPWKQLALPVVTAAAEEFLGATGGRRVVYVVPPGVDESRLSGPGDRSSAVVGQYAAALASRFAAAGATLVDTPTLLAPLGSRAFAEDGLHLTGAAYDVLLPAVRSALLRVLAADR